MTNKMNADVLKAKRRQPKRWRERKTSTKTQKWYSVDIYILHKYIYIQMGGAKLVEPHPLNIKKRLMKPNRRIAWTSEKVGRVKAFEGLTTGFIETLTDAFSRKDTSHFGQFVDRYDWQTIWRYDSRLVWWFHKHFIELFYHKGL